MKTSSIPADTCPICSHRWDEATDVSERNTPKVGDFSVCLECGTILVFVEGLRLRVCGPRDLHNAPRETLERLMQIHQMIKDRGPIEEI
jgi:hypothetical protein